MSRISPGTILLAFMAVVCGLLGTALLAQKETAAPPSATADEPGSTVVPVASAPLQAGRELTLGDVTLLQLTPEQIRRRNIRGGYMASSTQIIGRVLKTNLAAGETFRTDNLFAEGTGPGIVDSLLPGRRAVTIGVGGNDVLLGFAVAGSWVDVIYRHGGERPQGLSRDESRRQTRRDRAAARFASGDADYPQATITLMQRVRILALNSSTLGARSDRVVQSADADVSVTLEVTPEQAELLRTVEGRGELSLVLRSPDDLQQRTHTPALTLDDILERPQEPNLHRMEVFLGTASHEVVFEKQNFGEASATDSALWARQTPPLPAPRLGNAAAKSQRR